MPASANKLTIVASLDGVGQAKAFLDEMDIRTAAFGDTLLAYQLNDGVDRERSFIKRLAPMDPHHSRVDLLSAFNLNQSSTRCFPLVDADILKTGANGMAAATSAYNVIGWYGGWSGGTYPNAGAPGLTSNGGVNFATLSVGFGSGTDSWVCRFMGSEYGLYYIADNGTPSSVQHECSARPTDTTAPGRNIEVVATPTAAGPYTFAAPTGTPGVHLEFESDGRIVQVTFPAGVAMTVWEIARAITMAAGGFIAGAKRSILPLPGTDLLVVRIPKLRFPTAGTNPTGIQPRIRLRYQDPAFVAAGLSFGRYLGISMDTITTGSRGQLRRAASTFPANLVRIGSYVYNRTRNEWAVVKAFTTTTNPLDTIICDSVGGTWVAGDVYDIYPFCDHGLGTGHRGGIYQATLWDPADDTVAFGAIAQGADQKVVLNDLYGEAQGHYTAGQGLFVQNNGCAVILEVDSVAGFVLGEIVQNPDTGALGVVRAIDATNDRLLVDTIQGRILAPRLNFDASLRYLAWNPYNADTVQTWDRVQSYADPESPAKIGTGNAIIGSGFSGVEGSSYAGWLTEGQSGLLQVVAITQAKDDGGASDDFRTVLTLDTDGAAVNPTFKVFPSAVVGTRARLRRLIESNARYHYIMPHCGGSTTANFVNKNIRGNERNNVTTEPTHTPDVETSSYDLASWVTQSANDRFGRGILGAHAHFRGINPAAGAAVSPGDQLPEQRDLQRLWIAGGGNVYVGSTWGAGTVSPAIVQLACIGPADAAKLG